ncbi:unnamed protein product, partial [Didymodactylos carnosus]
LRLASIIIPLFISVLPSNIDDKSSTNNKDLISYSLERIQCLVPLYSNEFRQILQVIPELRTKLESSIKRQQQQKQENETNQQQRSTALNGGTGTQYGHIQLAPTIQLRIDFSNFKS